MDAASNNSVDDIRELRDSVAYAPSGGATKLTVTHDLTGAPGLASLVAGGGEGQGAGGGWAWVLSGLKTVLETGASLDR